MICEGGEGMMLIDFKEGKIIVIEVYGRCRIEKLHLSGVTIQPLEYQIKEVNGKTIKCLPHAFQVSAGTECEDAKNLLDK